MDVIGVRVCGEANSNHRAKCGIEHSGLGASRIGCHSTSNHSSEGWTVRCGCFPVSGVSMELGAVHSRSSSGHGLL